MIILIRDRYYNADHIQFISEISDGMTGKYFSIMLAGSAKATQFGENDGEDLEAEHQKIVRSFIDACGGQI